MAAEGKLYCPNADFACQSMGILPAGEIVERVTGKRLRDGAPCTARCTSGDTGGRASRLFSVCYGTLGRAPPVQSAQADFGPLQP
jgi:hypothetical protein